MKNKFLLSAVVFALATLPAISLAEEAEVELNAGNGARLEAKVELEVRRKELEQKRESVKKEMESRRESLKAEVETKREIIKSEPEQKRETIKEEMEAKRESIKKEVEQRRENAIGKIQERLNEFVENIIERFEAAVGRLERLAERIDSRIVKMEAENIDVKNAKELLAIAKIKIETARTSISEVDLESQIISSSAATTTAVVKEDFQDLKAQMEKAKKDIKAAHATLVEVVKNLKSGYNKLKKL